MGSCDEARIVAGHLVPHALTLVIVAMTFGVGGVMLVEAALGFGVPPDTPTWGKLMTNAESYFAIAPLFAIVAGLLIAATVVSLSLAGDGLRDVLDPYDVSASRRRAGSR